MKRFIKAGLTGLIWIVLIIPIANRLSLAADDPVLTADKTLIAALAGGDKAKANSWLDPDFTWIDSARHHVGERRRRARAISNHLLSNVEDSKIIEHKYGKSVVWIQWNKGNDYSAHFWVKRPWPAGNCCT